MHGLGNDFMVIDATHQDIDLTPKDIRALGRRDTGVGFDQCLIIEPSRQDSVDFFYRIFNADGREVGQCGNGARCLARFIHHYGLSKKKELTVATCTTSMRLKINDDSSVSVNFGHPKLAPGDIPLLAEKEQPVYSVLLKHEEISFHAIHVGNPHAVIKVEDVKQAQVGQVGETISKHPVFPEETNVGFMQIISPEHIMLRVYERGCGETKACGSGAVAAVAAGRLFHQLQGTVKVSLPGGDLWVHWPRTEHDITLTGPASFVYEGILMNI